MSSSFGGGKVPRLLLTGKGERRRGVSVTFAGGKESDGLPFREEGGRTPNRGSGRGGGRSSLEPEKGGAVFISMKDDSPYPPGACQKRENTRLDATERRRGKATDLFSGRGGEKRRKIGEEEKTWPKSFLSIWDRGKGKKNIAAILVIGTLKERG